MAFQGDTIAYIDQGLESDDHVVSLKKSQVQAKFLKFVAEWHEKEQYKYKEQLIKNSGLGKYVLAVEMKDMRSFCSEMSETIKQRPISYIPILEGALKELYASIQNIPISQAPDFQLQISSDELPQPLRTLKSNQIGNLINVSGIIINSGKTMLRGKKMKAICIGCGHELSIELSSGIEGANLPFFCTKPRTQGESQTLCPKQPYQIMTDAGEFTDFQVLKIQECPDAIPTGEVPRTYMVCCEKYLVDKLVPGTRVTITGVYTIIERKNPSSDMKQAGLRQPYIICYSFTCENTGARRAAPKFSEADIDRFKRYGSDPNIYKKISESVGESIFGHEDIKKALACMLMGGSAKILPDKSRLRGDINILLLGDPSTAKSQFLKFIQKVAPISVYTSGKGSSAAGLTAAIIKDPNTGEFQLEGGALVLADGGVVCIDEFDKMRPQDRVAIHEAMEQQTISVAKAGITTILNSRTSVLAAANPIFGRYDDQKKVSDQIDLQTTILSRFDCIFIVRDVRNEENDKRLAKHIINLHSKATMTAEGVEIKTGFNVEELKNYILYAKMNFSPRLNDEAAITLQNLYIEDRKKVRQQKQDKKSHIPVTVRQLEAIVRLSESIAKMKLSKEVTKNDVEEAHRLFQVSTMQAIKSSHVLGMHSGNNELVHKIEEAIKNRIEINTSITMARLIEELEMKYSNTEAIHTAINTLVRREDFDSIKEGKVLVRRK